MFGNDMNATGFAALAQQFWQSLQQMAARPAAAPGFPPGAGFAVPPGFNGDPFAPFRQAPSPWGFPPAAPPATDFSALFAPLAQWGAALAQTDPSAQLRQAFEQWMKQGAELAQSTDRGGVEALRDWLQVPGLGPLREEQERWQAIARTRLEFDEVSLRFARHFQELMAKTQRRFELALGELSVSGRKLESARAAFDLWVDAGENTWAELAMSEAFQSDLGDLTNAQMRLQKAMQAQIDRFAAAAGLPSRIEVDATARKVAVLEREVRSLREQVRANAAQARGVEAVVPEPPAQAEPPVHVEAAKTESAVVVALPVTPRARPEAGAAGKPAPRRSGKAEKSARAGRKAAKAATRPAARSDRKASGKPSKSAKREAPTATVTPFPLVDAPRAFGRKLPEVPSARPELRGKRKAAK